MHMQDFNWMVYVYFVGYVKKTERGRERQIEREREQINNKNDHMTLMKSHDLQERWVLSLSLTLILVVPKFVPHSFRVALSGGQCMHS